MRTPSLCLLLLLVVACNRNTNADPAPATAAAKELAASNNKFGLSFVGRNYEAGKNQAISPLSLAMALQLAATGADGETRRQMLDVLAANNLDLPESNRELIDTLNRTKGVKLNVANSIWVNPSQMQLAEEYRVTAESKFDALARELNFSDPKAVDTINNWVSEHTNKRIPQLLDEVNPQAAAYLINAVYFKGEWTARFDKEQTRDQAFTLEDGTRKQVPTMFREKDYSHGADGGTVIVRLTLGKDKGASMWFALPAPDSSAEKLAASLNAESLARWAKAVKEEKDLPLFIPRFTFRYKVEANKTLKAMGMTHAFDEAKADFSRMGKSPAGNLFISRVLHEVFIEVNEEGAEAAAATAVEMKPTSVPQPIQFNRPFVFVITDDGTGSVLFAGVVHDPKA